MPNLITIGDLTNLINAGEKILTILEYQEDGEMGKLVARMRNLVEGDEFTRGPNVRSLVELSTELRRLHIYLKRLRSAEIGGGS